MVSMKYSPSVTNEFPMKASDKVPEIVTVVAPLVGDGVASQSSDFGPTTSPRCPDIINAKSWSTAPVAGTPSSVIDDAYTVS